jgi:hypothetical protein
MSIPSVYKNLTPTQTVGGLTPLQLALANYLTTGTIPPFGVNQDFLASINAYADSGILSPTTVDARTGIPKTPDILPDVVALAYLTSGNDLYILREAQDCGPDDKNRVEKVYIGDRTLIAKGTFAYYGGVVYDGTAASGARVANISGGSA